MSTPGTPTITAAPPLIPSKVNVVYKEGPSEHLPQFGLDTNVSPVLGYQPAPPTYVRSISPMLSSMRQPSSFATSPPQSIPQRPLTPTYHSTPLTPLEVQRVSASGLDVSQDQDVINIVEQIVYQPVVIEVEKIVEVPEIQYREIPVHKTVEVPEVVEQVVLKEVPVPQYVEIEVPEYVEKEKIVKVERVKPLAVESVLSVTYEVPSIEVEYEIIEVPYYVPQFIEVPVPVEQMDEETRAQLETLANDIAMTTSAEYPALSDLEDLFERSNRIRPKLEADVRKMQEHWKFILENGYKETVAQSI
eukprot:Blabericola_migrator_1__7729@NODE_394_length_8993_cov_144_363433_g314_i0_p2_GENE_NODE_394_length_8993_cov_144_363433_g314_i0NODE_394_length_8993_cov_144_363433_g314_i0_p2_ORF_typecomplete_len304_score52_62IMCp/PF12314_8/0_014IMCp/PF12314_8/70_NODE_394_length_8993_cov_144_363433_g314_i01301041